MFIEKNERWTGLVWLVARASAYKRFGQALNLSVPKGIEPTAWTSSASLAKVLVLPVELLRYKKGPSSLDSHFCMWVSPFWDVSWMQNFTGCWPAQMHHVVAPWVLSAASDSAADRQARQVSGCISPPLSGASLFPSRGDSLLTSMKSALPFC